MFFGSISESLPRQVPHLPQCSYGQDLYTWANILNVEFQ